VSELPLSRGLVALVDDRLFAWLSQWKWTAGLTVDARLGRTFYAYRNARASNGRLMRLYLHRAVLQPPDGMMVDHINGDGLDNRRENLRAATAALNASNRHAEPAGNVAAALPAKARRKPGYWGVRQTRQRYKAKLVVNGREFRTKTFETAEEAALAYDALVREHLGPGARLNFPG
jgi:hypothetical protein